MIYNRDNKDKEERTLVGPLCLWLQSPSTTSNDQLVGQRAKQLGQLILVGTGQLWQTNIMPMFSMRIAVYN